jgi:hypothetical protein
MSKYPLSGKAIDTQSIDEREKLVRRSSVNTNSELWHLVNFASFIFFQDENSALLISQLLNAMGVKIIASNVALTGLITFPSYASYSPQNKERVLLIAQTNSNENGFYEWQSGGTLVRLYDWRDIIAGNGIATSANNIAVKLLAYLSVGNPPRNDNFLQFDNAGNLFARIAADAVGLKLNANRELYIDGAELGGGGGGVSVLDVPNPDIDVVRKNSSFEAVYLPNTTNFIEVLGGNFRNTDISPVTLVCDGFENVIYYPVIKHNKITGFVNFNGLIGSHIVTAKHLTLQSLDNDGSSPINYNKMTILGAAIIDTVSPPAKRDNTTTITVTGEGFAVISEWAANNTGITIVAFRFITRLLIEVDVSVSNAVPSGLYNLVCTNAFSSVGSFTSGTSGNNKLVVFGDPFITTVFRSPEGAGRLAEVLMGETVDIICNGFDLTDDFVIAAMDINSVSGTSNKKTINVTAYNDVSDIGIKNIVNYDYVNGADSGISGDNKLALNYPYDNATWVIPNDFRAYGGTTDLADWTITPDTDGVIFEKIGGSGACYLEITDLFLVASLLEYSLGWTGTVLEIECLTPVADLDTSIGCGILIDSIGEDFATADYELSIRKDIAQPTSFRGSYSSGSTLLLVSKLEVSIQRTGNTANNTSFFATNMGAGVPNSIFQRNYTSHENKALHIVMGGNYTMKLKMKGHIGY